MSWRGAVENKQVGEKKSQEKFPALGKARRKNPRRENPGTHEPAEDLDVLLAGHCRHATTEIPPGKPGARWAAAFLAALPEACRRRLPDVSATGPRLFAFLVEQGLLAGMPSPRLIPAALALVAEVSPLLQARSRRQWVLLLGRVRDAGSPIAAALRERTPRSQLDAAVPPPAARPLRTAVLRAERDQLAAELAAERSQTEHLQAENKAQREHLAKLAAQLARRERMEEKITRLEEEVPQLRRDAAEMAASVKTLRAERDKARQERADIRRMLGVPEDDPRDVVELVSAEAQARLKLVGKNLALEAELDKMRRRCAELEAQGSDVTLVAALSLTKIRAEKAERALAATRNELAAARKSLSELQERLEARKIRLHGAQRQIEAQEIELAEFQAEIEILRARSFLTPIDDIRRARRVAADKARELQRNRRPLTEDDT